jgi:hypothetical protein
MKTEIYTASLDSFTKTLTWFIFILFAGLSIRSVLGIIHAAGNVSAILVQTGVLLLLAAILLVSYAFSPQGYVLQGDELIIKRPARDKHLKLNDVLEVRMLTEADMSWTIRTFGVGGLFGHYGKYYNSKLGNFTQYATRRNHQIFIRTRQGKKLVLTPDDVTLADKLQLAVLQPV